MKLLDIMLVESGGDSTCKKHYKVYHTVFGGFCREAYSGVLLKQLTREWISIAPRVFWFELKRKVKNIFRKVRDGNSFTLVD